MHVDGGHRQKPIDFQRHHLQHGRLASILDFLVSRLTVVPLWIWAPNFNAKILMNMGRSLLIFSHVIFKMAAWRPYWIFRSLDSVGGSFRSVSQVCFGISVSNFMCMSFMAEAYWLSAMSLSKWLPGGHIVFFGSWTLTLVWHKRSDPNFSNTLPVCMCRSLWIFSVTIFKMAAWQPYWIVGFLDSNLNLALNIKSKLKSSVIVSVGRFLVILNDVQLQSTHCQLPPSPTGRGILVDHWSTICS